MKFLVVGLGSAGQRHARVIRTKYPDAKIFTFRGNHKMGLISEDTKTIQNNIDPVNHYRLIEMFGMENVPPDLDLAIISSPINLHLEHTNFVVEKVKKILVEKPLCYTKSDLSEFIKLYQKSSSLIFIGYQHEFNPIYKYISEFLFKKSAAVQIDFAFFETLNSMNPFRDMKKHHLSNLGNGAAYISMSHEIERFLAWYPKLFGSIYVNCFCKPDVSNKNNELQMEVCVAQSSRSLSKDNNLSLNSMFSFNYPSHIRKGQISSESEFIKWDIFNKRVEINTDRLKLTKKFKYSSDQLIKLQLERILEIDRKLNEVDEKFKRSIEIVKILRYPHPSESSVPVLSEFLKKFD